MQATLTAQRTPPPYFLAAARAMNDASANNQQVKEIQQ
jgi:hypothetical protein